MLGYRDGASRSDSPVSADHEQQGSHNPYFAQGDQVPTQLSPDNDNGQFFSPAGSSEDHPLGRIQLRDPPSSSGHIPSSSSNHFQQGRSTALNPASTTSSFSHAFREIGLNASNEPLPRRGFLNVPQGAGYGGLGSRSGLRPLSQNNSATVDGADYKIGGHYPDVSVFLDKPEDDDWLHDVRGPGDLRVSYMCFTVRGLLNVGFLALLGCALLMLFAGWPVLTYVNKVTGFSLWRTSDVAPLPLGPTWINVLDNNGNPQRVTKSPLRGLIDRDTPDSAKTKMSSDGQRKMKLVFSDEFNEDGRTFFEGDDPYWTAVDLNYWGTSDYEWYTPLGATTKDGSLQISLTEQPMNNLNFKSAMLQSWNKLCVQGGYLEVSVMLPGDPTVPGYWPAVWTMGNLGRAGYGATNEGMWPYNYDTCDVGTMPNQTYLANGTGGPLAAEVTATYPDSHGPGVSIHPGQKLSRCTCAASTDHPGPKHEDGSWMGRGASELDLLEGTSNGLGRNSMSLQAAPYNSGQNITPGFTEVYHKEDTMNVYVGGVYQQAVSAIIRTPQNAYQLSGGDFSTYGVEWVPHYRDVDPYVTWMTAGEKSWRLNAGALGPDKLTEVGQRLVPPEPMYIIFNLGISGAFTFVDWKKIQFPGVMSIDYVRIYQDEGMESLSCDGAFPEMPTVAYIEKHAEAYWNANLTTWKGKREAGAYGKVFPGNAIKGECS
ncbi:unnamed protein product [Tilletia caries]|nr:unnamed protein product [Tilletia caries]CAD6977458.1 unnamed protein product [Tilletia controversa]